MKQDKIQELAEELWCDLADESDGWQTTMNYESFIKAIHKALTIPVVSNCPLCDSSQIIHEDRYCRTCRANY